LVHIRVDPFNLQEHFIQCVYSSGGSQVHRSFVQLVWLYCMWVLWNEKNNIQEQGKYYSPAVRKSKVTFFKVDEG